MVTYTRKVVFGSAIVLLMQFFASIIAYLTRMILARNLTTTEYGLFIGNALTNDLPMGIQLPSFIDSIPH